MYRSVCAPLDAHQLPLLMIPATHPNYAKYVDLLSPGWIPGRKVDNSDDQYSTFRDNVPYMFLLVVLHPLLRKVYEALYPSEVVPSLKSSPKEHVNNSTLSHAADARMNRRVTFDLCFGLLLICGLHGFSAFKVLLILYTNYCIATRIPKEYVSTATWAFNIGILFANEFGRGYPYAAIADMVSPWSAIGGDHKAKINWGSVLDAYGGLVPRWEILFKVTILRSISFNIDYVWSLGRGTSCPIEVGS